MAGFYAAPLSKMPAFAWLVLSPPCTHPRVDWNICGEGFTWETQDRERDIAAARAGWAKACTALADPDLSLVVLDEILPPILARPTMQHVVITGRAAHQELLDAADTVAAIHDVKHAFRAGVRAQEGIDR